MEEKEKNNGVLQENSENSKDFLDKDVEIDEHEGITIKQKEVKKEINLGESVLEDVEEENKSKDKSNPAKGDKGNNYKYFIYLAIILIITVIVLWVNLVAETTDKDGNVVLVYQVLGDVFGSMNIGYFVLYICVILLSYALNSLILFCYARLYTKHYKFHQAVANNCIGAFYSAITPSSSGGQFAQIYTFNKQGIPVSNGASIFVMNFIVYQVGLIIIGIISLITRFNAIFAIESIPITIWNWSISIPIWVFIVFGFALNLLVIVLLFVMSYSEKFMHFISVTAVNFLAKIKILHNPEEKSKNMKIQVENYRIELRRLNSNLPFAITIFLLNFVCLIVTQLAPFFAGLSLNAFDFETQNVALKMYDCVAFLNFHQMITGLIPLPGSAGVSELVFNALFSKSSNYFASDFYSSGGFNILILVWRFGTFYIPFIINGIVSATYKTRGVPIKERVVPMGDRKTMLTIQLETYEERKASSDTIYETRVMERKELMEKLKIKKPVKKKKKPEVKTEEIKKDETLVIGGDDEHSDFY